MSKLSTFVRGHPRLIASLVLATLATLLLPSWYSGVDHVLVFWDVLIWSYMIALWWWMSRATPEDIPAAARSSDYGAKSVLFMFCVAAIMTLLAVIVEIGEASGLAPADQVLPMVLVFLTLVGTWLLIPTIYTLHYTHLYYTEPYKTLIFPDETREPSYYDVAYFAFTIALASQTADIAVGGTRMRMLVLVQAILAFVFNTSILGFSINLVASVVQ